MTTVPFHYIHDAETHHVISSTSFTDAVSLAAWPWVQDTVAAEYGCHPDEVRCIETDDGDRVTANGRIVAYVKMG